MTRIHLITPAPARSRLGNRITALRWQALLRGLGCTVRVAREWRGEPCDLLIALHATKSARSVEAFRARRPDDPVVIALTGTDLYHDLGRDPRTRAAIRRATLLIVLQAEALRALDAPARRKARVVLQSAVAERRAVRGPGDPPRVVALAHVRRVKDPLLAARAARLLPADSRLRVEHYGAALDRRLAAEALRESRRNPRWTFRGERSHAAARRLLADADVFVQTSLAEGGSSAMAEAIVSGLAVLSTRTPGAVGMLGADHPGLFPPRDARALAELLARCERDPRALRALRAASRARAALFAPEKERAAWASILRELGLAPPARGRALR